MNRDLPRFPWPRWPFYVDEALRETENELAAFMEQRQARWVPEQWRREAQFTRGALETPLAQTDDHTLYETLLQEGERAVAAERWARVNEHIREMGGLRVRI